MVASMGCLGENTSRVSPLRPPGVHLDIVLKF